CASPPIKFLFGSDDKVVFPVPDKPKKTAVSPSSPILAEQCRESTLLRGGKIKLKAENIPFLISPVQAVPPIIIIFLVKFITAKLCCLVPSIAGSAINPGAAIMVHSGSKDKISSLVGLKNIL